MTRTSETEPSEAEIWWVEGGGDEERDKEARDNAAAVGGLVTSQHDCHREEG